MSVSDAGTNSVRPFRRLLVLLPLVLFLGLAVLFLLRLQTGEPGKIPSALIGRPVPAFELPALAGLTGPEGRPLPGLSSADFAGRVTVVNVWASWCAPCRAEHPLLMRLGQDSRLRLVGIAWKDKPENSRRFLGALGNPFAAVGIDESGRTAIDWGVYGVPETFVIAPDGTIAFKWVGPLTEAALADTLLPAIAAARRRSP